MIRPGSVSERTRLPWRVKISTPSSSSSSMIALETPGWRRKQRLGGFGQIEVLAHSLADEAELMEVHI